jgi:two-component system, NtrC family, sensor histidine kinase PilS
MTTNPTATQHLVKDHWHSLKLYNGYRILIALMFAVEAQLLKYPFEQIKAGLSFIHWLILSYFIFSLISAFLTWIEMPRIRILLPIQIIADIAFILLLMYSQGDSEGTVGILLIIAIASASLISEGRLALFYAAVATIGILIGQTQQNLSNTTSYNYTSAVLLSLGCFATAWLAYSLAKRVQQSDELASQRGLDIENMEQVNALITQEMQDGVLVVDGQLQIKQHNMQAVALLGLDITEPNFWQHKKLQDISTEIAMLTQQWLNEQSATLPKGNESTMKLSVLSRELQLRISPISANKQDGAVIFIEDWSQLQTQAHQVKLAALGRLTANIAHEIRNPLSAISHANQLLQEEENNPVTQRMLQIIGDNVLRLDQIIKDVLELNRRDRTNQEAIDLESFIVDFHMQFCSVEKLPAAGFKTEMDEKLAIITFDRRHLNQILWNLCKNGWRHSKNKKNSLILSCVTVGKGPFVQINVRDDGDGIPMEIQAQLFEPFFTTENSGTGLGLYIARELAEANGAKLNFTSDYTGTVFTLMIKKNESI